jgi:hypothetical protein
MDLKNAVAVCLISLVSATIVVLIARTLDSQAASQMEPQLASIVEELRALRAQGGVGGTPGSPTKVETVGDGLVVYYLHSNIRCSTCLAIEAQAEEAVKTHFASQLSKGEVIWKIVNYEQAAGKPLAAKFQIQMPVVVLARMKDGKIEDWNRLDKVWALVGDKPAFTKYVRGEIDRMLASEKTPTPAASQSPGPAIPTPGAEAVPSQETPDIPIP